MPSFITHGVVPTCRSKNHLWRFLADYRKILKKLKELRRAELAIQDKPSIAFSSRLLKKLVLEAGLKDS